MLRECREYKKAILVLRLIVDLHGRPFHFGWLWLYLDEKYEWVLTRFDDFMTDVFHVSPCILWKHVQLNPCSTKGKP